MDSNHPPKSILIIGCGVFGLSTAWALTKRASFANTAISLVDDAAGQFPPPDAASMDSSRIIRPDYADPHYTTLAAEAQQSWRKQGENELGGQGRYYESGFVLMADHPADDGFTGKTGMDYARESWENVRHITNHTRNSTESIETFDSPESLRAFLKSSGRPGDWGYLNRLSGWANAGKAMDWLYRQVKATGRVQFIDGRVVELTVKGNRVTGAQLSNSLTIKAEIVIVAAGAWTGSLIDLRGRVEATGHALGYIDLTEEENALMEKQPVVLNLTSGLFYIPPTGRSLKIARHSFGYVNPVPVTRALPLSPYSARKTILVSQPSTSRNNDGADRLPLEAENDLRRALSNLVPLSGLQGRPWSETRLCWYSDTRDGDWLIDWHPGWKGLFVCCGDSGHGFKFLPLLGDKVLDCMLAQGGELGEKWRWKNLPSDSIGGDVSGEKGYHSLITQDGSRGGKPGLILAEQLQVTSI